MYLWKVETNGDNVFSRNYQGVYGWGSIIITMVDKGINLDLVVLGVWRGIEKVQNLLITDQPLEILPHLKEL